MSATVDYSIPAEKVDTEKVALQNRNSNVNTRLRVCDVCSSFLSIFDSDRRLADHFGGKLHLGYMQIKKKIGLLREARGAPFLKDEDVLYNNTQRSSNMDRQRRSRSRERYEMLFFSNDKTHVIQF